MKLVFTKNSPLNTTLVDQTSGLVMYEIETERSLMSKTTVIRKPFTNRRGQPVPHTSTEVAKIQWKTWSSDRIVYYGCSMKRGDFMPKAGLFSEGFVITANGAKFRWTGSSGKSLPKLVTNNRKKKLVAEMHKQRHVFRRRKAYLEVAPAGLAMLDQIVVSLVYVEKKRREKGVEVDNDPDKGGDDGGGGDGGGGFDGGGGADGGGGGGAS